MFPYCTKPQNVVILTRMLKRPNSKMLKPRNVHKQLKNVNASHFTYNTTRLRHQFSPSTRAFPGYTTRLSLFKFYRQHLKRHILCFKFQQVFINSDTVIQDQLQFSKTGSKDTSNNILYIHSLNCPPDRVKQGSREGWGVGVLYFLLESIA